MAKRDSIGIADQKQEWDIPFSEYRVNQNNHLIGTKIVIGKLKKEIINGFMNTEFEADLMKYLERRIGLAISRGLEIRVNDKRLKENNIRLINTKSVYPVVKEYMDMGVRVKIVAGIASGEEKKLLTQNAGWYIYCNERLVVAADKSSLTTWKDVENSGNGVIFQNDYASFRGIVLFYSTKPELLPCNTTKTGIDEMSYLYLRARENMQEIFKCFRAFLDEIKQRTIENDDRIEETIVQMDCIEMNAQNLKKIANTKKELSIANIEYITEPYVTICYKEPKEVYDKVKKILEVNSNRAVGEKTFEYFVDAEL